jgi:hypothetical protein
MVADSAFYAYVLGAAIWAVSKHLASAPAAAVEVLADHPEGLNRCARCGEPLRRDQQQSVHSPPARSGVVAQANVRSSARG